MHTHTHTHAHTHAHTHTNKSGEVLEKIQVNGPEGGEISKKEIPGSKRSMYSYILTYSRR